MVVFYLTFSHVDLYLLQKLIVGGVRIQEIMSKKGEVKLADYFVVALKMLELEEKGERVWFSKLVESLSETFSREEVAKSLNTLEDWLLVSSEYGETSPDHAGRLYYLTEEGRKQMIKIRRKIKIIIED